MPPSKDWAPLTKDLRADLHRRRRGRRGGGAGSLRRAAGSSGTRRSCKLWRAHWAEFVPFLAFPPEVRRVIYTTNLIESMNARLRKVTRNRGQFPSEQAALKVLYLAVRNLEEYRGPNGRDPQLGLETSAASVHDLLRGTHPHPMTATITYTDDRALSHFRW